MKRVKRSYGEIDALKLSTITSERSSPWVQVWNSGKIDLMNGSNIPNDLIKDYYDNKIKENE